MQTQIIDKREEGKTSSRNKIIFSLEYLAREAKNENEIETFCIIQVALCLLKGEDVNLVFAQQATCPTLHEDILRAANLFLKFADIPKKTQKEFVTAVHTTTTSKYDC